MSTKEFYNNIYKANPAKWNSEARDEFAFNALSSVISEPASMLDFGCGNGHTLEYFSKRWQATQYYGVDISTVALDIARKKLPTAKFSESVGDFEFPSVITMLGVAEHFEKLSHIRWVADHLLFPSGLLYVEVPNCLAYSSSKAEGWRKTTGGTGQVEWHLKRESWERILTANGLQIVKALNGRQASWQFVWVLRIA